MDYKISMRLVHGKDIDGNPYQAARSCGDFRVTKHYTVTNLKNPSKKPNGYVVQYIEKRTEVTHKCGNKWNITTVSKSECQDSAAEQTLTRSEDIEKFTAGNVKFMTQNYLELFVIKNGESTFDDAFQNGAVVKYIWEADEEDGGKLKWQPIIESEDESFFTKGNISMRGTNIFLPTSSKITKLYSWDKSTATPANGLPYLEPTDANLAAIFALRASEPLVHELAVSWNYPTAGRNANNSKIKVISPVRGRSVLPPRIFSMSGRKVTIAHPVAENILSPVFKKQPSKKTVITIKTPTNTKPVSRRTTRSSAASRRTTRSSAAAAATRRSKRAPMTPISEENNLASS